MQEEDSSHPSLPKIIKSIQEIRSLQGIVKEIIISKASRDEIKSARKTLSLKCTSQHLGYFSFVIRYISIENRESKKITHSFYS